MAFIIQTVSITIWRFNMANNIMKSMLVLTATETQLRKWKRRLLVALTDEEKKKCKYYIKMYGGR